MPTISITTTTSRYDVMIEAGMLRQLGCHVAQHAPHERAMLAVDRNVRDTHGEVAATQLREHGYELAIHELEASESCKSLDTVRSMYDTMLAHRMERSSPVIALGGGIVGDIAGYAAATYLRGVPLVHVPTTLLAMVDASIGGKTGVNHPLPSGGLGKNLIGAFWPPRAIITDPETLRTLPEREFRCGLAECVKHGLIHDPSLLDLLEANHKAIVAIEPEPLTAFIRQSAQAKAMIVQQDEREAGERALLNLGHTFAHAIESQPGLDVKHGEAVAIGLCAAAHVSVEQGYMDPDDRERMEALLRALGLPTRLPKPADEQALLRAMGWDKKVSGGRVRLILPHSPLGRAVIDEAVSDEQILVGWRHVKV